MSSHNDAKKDSYQYQYTTPYNFNSNVQYQNYGQQTAQEFNPIWPSSYNQFDNSQYQDGYSIPPQMPVPTFGQTEESPTLLSNLCSFELGYKIGLLYLEAQARLEGGNHINDSKMHDTDTFSSVEVESDHCDTGRSNSNSNSDPMYSWQSPAETDSDETNGKSTRRRYSRHNWKGKDAYNLFKSAVEPKRKQPKRLAAELTNGYGIPDELPLLDLASMDTPVDLHTLSALVTRVFNLPPPPNLPKQPEPDLTKFDFLMSLPLPPSDKNNGHNLSYPLRTNELTDTTAYGHPKPIMTYRSFHEPSVLYTCWAATPNIVEDIKFDLEIVIKMVTDSEYLDYRYTQNYTSEITSLNEADLNNYLNSFVIKSFVQELVIWCQYLKDMSDKFHNFSLKVVQINALREEGLSVPVTDTEILEEYDQAVLLISYKNKITEARKEVNKIRCILWLLIQSSSNCLSQWNPPSSTRELYESILTFLKLPHKTHDSANDMYNDTHGYLLKNVVRLIFFPLPGVNENIEGIGEGVSEEEATEEAFRELIRGLSNRFIDYLETNESVTLTQMVNTCIFSRVEKGQPQVIRSDSYIDLRNAVKAISKNLAENPHHVRLGAMHEDFEEWIFAATPLPSDLNPQNNDLQPEVQEPITTRARAPDTSISKIYRSNSMPLLRASLDFLPSVKSKSNSCVGNDQTKAKSNLNVNEVPFRMIDTQTPLIPAKIGAPMNPVITASTYPRPTESVAPKYPQGPKYCNNQMFRLRNGPGQGFGQRTYYYDRNYNYIPVPVCRIPVMTSTMYRPRRPYNNGVEIPPRFRPTPVLTGPGQPVSHQLVRTVHYRANLPVNVPVSGPEFGPRYIRNSNTYLNAPIQHSFSLRQRNGYNPSCRLCVSGAGPHACSRY